LDSESESESESGSEQEHQLAGIGITTKSKSKSKSNDHDQEHEHEQKGLVAEDIPFCENWDRVSVDFALRQFIGRCNTLLSHENWQLVLSVLGNIVLLVCVLALIALDVCVTGPDRFSYLAGPTEDTSTL
jgi:hypothetical protein